MDTLLDLHTDGVQYNVHPVVIFSILDHYKRRAKDQERVIGTLLGERDAATNTVHVKNCFPIYHSEKDNKAKVPIDYHRQVLALHQRVAPNEVVLGWYSTGAEVSFITSEMHDVYRGETENPMLLTVDTALTDSRLGVRAYTAHTVSVFGKRVVSRFQGAATQLTAFQSEKIGVDALINGTPDDEKLDAPATLMTDLQNLFFSMDNLLQKLEIVEEYVQKVQKKEVRGDPEVGRAIAAALSAIVPVPQDTLEKIFTTNTQDMLMVLHLASLTRQQLKLAESISGVL
jgi:translation initiation factor 3 subunit F